MRVIAGSAKGIRLVTREGDDTRPTTDKVKEAVFGSIQFGLAGSRVLDLFAGSGALGIEALSRGAESAVFVERDKKALEAIKENLAAARLTKNARVMASDCFSAMERLDGRFDYVFMDPPYASGLYQRAFDMLTEKELADRDTTFVIEHDGSLVLERAAVKKTKRYGKIYVSFAVIGE